jgi:thiol-disulfide isomerase/thioredoxin
MNAIYTVIVVCASLCTVYSQNPISIRGQIEGHHEKSVALYTYNNYLEKKPAFLAQVTTDADGRFASQIMLSTAQPVMLSYGSPFPMIVWIEKDDSIFIDIRKPYKLTYPNGRALFDKGDVLYSGRGATINNYLFDADLTIYNPKTHETAQSRSIEKYHVFLDSLQQARRQLRQTAWPQKFSSKAEAFLVGEIVSSTFNHKYMAEVYKTNKTAEDSTALTTSALRTYRLDWKFSSDLSLTSDAYRQSLISYCNQMAQEKIKKRPATNVEKEIYFSCMYREAYDQLQYSTQTHEFSTAFTLYLMAMFIDGQDSLAALINDFHQKFPASTYYPILAKNLQSRKTAPEIIAFDTTNNLFDLATLKGKPIYIDVWASWCGPCMKEFPNSKKVAAKFKGKIHMVYLNIDDNEPAWRKAMQNQKLEGVNLRADETTSRKIKDDFNIRAIPRYILIDKNGNVFRSNAERPTAIEPDILSLLK